MVTPAHSVGSISVQDSGGKRKQINSDGRSRNETHSQSSYGHPAGLNTKAQSIAKRSTRQEAFTSPGPRARSPETVPCVKCGKKTSQVVSACHYRLFETHADFCIQQTTAACPLQRTRYAPDPLASPRKACRRQSASHQPWRLLGAETIGTATSNKK